MIIRKLASMALCCVLGGMLVGCDRDESGTAADHAASSSQTSTAPPVRLGSRLQIEQALPGESPYSRLDLLEDGAWQCDRCRGNADDATGQLEPAQMEALFALLSDPALKQESRAQKGVRKSNCRIQIESTFTYADITILWSDCPGNGPPPVTAKVLDLLAGATTLSPETP